ncbi:MAG: alpha/beta hydrolase family protein, partial [Gammaproteobacteria bacterium]
MTRIQPALREHIIYCIMVATLATGRSVLADTTMPYPEFRASFASTLLHKGPAPQKFTNEQPPSGVHQVAYRSGSLVLKAWLALPRRIAAEPVPGVVYLHGGFSFGKEDLFDAYPFYQAGYAVMTPMLRAENGNPGDFELLLGEVDDAVAAVEWLAAQPFIDPQRIYVFGHSIGGAGAALMTLREGAKVRHTGGSGGLYGPDAFDRWKSFAPFDTDSEDEQRARLLLGNEQWMQVPHHAYIGRDDELHRSLPSRLSEPADSDTKLEVEFIEGDHFSSLPRAIERYLR